MTTVYDLGSGKEAAVYSLPPKEALIACWEQHHKNHSTWEYAKKLEEEFYPLEEGEYGYTLGKLWVRK